MPTSDPRTISVIVHRAIWAYPLSVLELGIGYGKYGTLFREYLDWNRYNSMERHIKIVGVEGFPAYRNSNWDAYDSVELQNFGDRIHWSGYQGYGLVLVADALEHLEKPHATDLLTHLAGSNAHVLVSTPSGESPQGEYMGNQLEIHRSSWTAQEFQNMGGSVLYDRECVVSEWKWRK